MVDETTEFGNKTTWGWIHRVVGGWYVVFLCDVNHDCIIVKFYQARIRDINKSDDRAWYVC